MGIGSGDVPNIVARGVAIALSLLIVVVVVRRIGAPPEPTEPPPRSSLRSWELLGCYELEPGAWEEAVDEWVVDTRPPPGEGGEAAPADAPEPAVPVHVMLAADSVDQWGRRLTSYRAVSLSPVADAAPSLRWFVRADTLWIVWSRPGVRGGAALFAEGDSLRGRARVSRRSRSPDLSAPVTAWRINCATLGRRGRPGPRR